MAGASEKKVCVSIPFLSQDFAALAYGVLSVDTELKGSGVRRDITSEGSNLVIYFYGTDLKRLRVSVNSMLKNIVLIVRTIKQFENSLQ